MENSEGLEKFLKDVENIPMDDLSKSAVAIGARDRFYGMFSSQIQYNYNTQQYFLATVGLFVLLEHSVKEAAGMLDGSFHDTIRKLHKENKITDTEYRAINALKKLRNIIFHENMHSGGLEIEGMFNSFDENETYNKILESDMLAYMRMARKLLAGQSQIDDFD